MCGCSVWVALVIWERARTDGALLVTKDEDFLRLSVTRGFPPKVICLAIGNVIILIQ